MSHSFLLSEVLKVKDVLVSVLFHSATVETYMELSGHFAQVCQFVRMQFPICIVITRNTSIFSLSRFMEGQRSLVQSVKVVFVVSFSFCHQKCDNFCKIQQENANWTGAIIYIWCFSAFFPLRPSLKAFYYTSVMARVDVSTMKWMVFGSVDLAHSEKLTLL